MVTIKQKIANPRAGPRGDKLELSSINQRGQNYLYLDYLAELSQQVDPAASRLAVAFNRFVVVLFGGYICSFDLLANRWNTNKRLETNRSHTKCPNSKWALKFPWLSRLMFLVSACALLHLSNIVAKLYASDFCSLKLARLRRWMSIYGADRPIPSHLAGPSKRNRSMRDIELQLVDQLGEVSRRTLFRSDFLAGYGLIFECSIFCLLVLFIYSQLVSRLVFVWLVPFDLPLVRDLLEPGQEQRRAHAYGARVVSRFIESSRQFARLAQARLLPPSDLARGSLAKLGPGDSRACRLLARMFEHGALMPISKSPVWIERRNRVQFWSHLVPLAYLAIITIASAFLGTGILIFNWGDLNANNQSSFEVILAEASAFWLMLVFGLTAIFLTPLLFIYSSDMIMSIEKLRGLIRECIHRNKAELHYYRAKQVVDCMSMRPSERSYHERARLLHTIDRMNSNYLFVLATFKVLMIQLAAFKRLLKPLIPLIYALVVLMPLLVRLHTPYFAEATSIDGSLLYWSALIINFVVLSCCNLILLPICYTHSRCLHLYRSLTSLMAHITDVHLLEPHLFDAHAVELLRKEIMKPNQLADQFVIRYCGFSGTLNSLVRVHFWSGFVTLSIVVDSDLSSFGALLRDPLGVYSF